MNFDVCAFSGGSGLVMHWEQETSTLLCSGDVRNITIWDMQSETRKQVTLLHSLPLGVLVQFFFFLIQRICTTLTKRKA
jgi:hypothetical protein